MKIGELVYTINGGDSLQRISKKLNLQPINLAKILLAIGYVYEDRQWIWKHKKPEPVNGELEDFIIQQLGMRIGELIRRLNRGESIEELADKLFLTPTVIGKVLKTLGYIQENSQWLWRGKGREPVYFNILDFIIYEKTFWQKLKLWILPVILLLGMSYGIWTLMQGKVVGDFMAYKAESITIKNGWGDDHLLIKQNGRFYFLYGQGPLANQVKGEYLEVLILRNDFGQVWYKLPVDKEK